VSPPSKLYDKKKPYKKLRMENIPGFIVKVNNGKGAALLRDNTLQERERESKFVN
jgi:hypothetical protein